LITPYHPAQGSGGRKMAQLGRRYLVHVRLGAGDRPTDHRIATAATSIQKILDALAPGTGNLKLAYTSHDGATFGFLIKTNQSARSILAELLSPGNDTWTGLGHERKSKTKGVSVSPPLLNEDSVLITEIGSDFVGQGFSKAWTWLQHH
jgi:hypothetical protein